MFKIIKNVLVIVIAKRQCQFWSAGLDRIFKTGITILYTDLLKKYMYEITVSFNVPKAIFSSNDIG